MAHVSDECAPPATTSNSSVALTLHRAPGWRVMPRSATSGAKSSQSPPWGRDRPVSGIGLWWPLDPSPVRLAAEAVDRHERGADREFMADKVDVSYP